MSDLVFYIGAHQDDWQFFRGEQAYRDIARGARTVFVYTTSGDSERDCASGWWQAREKGAVASCMAACVPQPERKDVPDFPPTESETINSKAVGIAIYQNTIHYFMRLPDGGMGGAGIKAWGNWSLQKLRVDGRATRTADGAAEYTSWDEFRSTLKEIIDREIQRSGAKRPRLHAAAFTEPEKPHHSDHNETRMALTEIMQPDPKRFCCDWWQSYTIGEMPTNLGPKAVWQKCQMFFVYHAYSFAESVRRGSPYDEFQKSWRGAYESWFTKSYPAFSDSLGVVLVKEDKEVVSRMNEENTLAGDVTNGAMPTAGQKLQVEGGCHPDLKGTGVEVVEVYDNWIVVAYDDPQHGRVTTGGLLRRPSKRPA